MLKLTIEFQIPRMTADNELENNDNENIVMVDNLENDNAALENEDRSIEELPGTYPFY